MRDLLGRKRIAALKLDLESAHENIEQLWKSVELWEATCIELADLLLEANKRAEITPPKKRRRLATAMSWKIDSKK